MDPYPEVMKVIQRRVRGGASWGLQEDGKESENTNNSTSYYDACQCHLCAKIFLAYLLRDMNNVFHMFCTPLTEQGGRSEYEVGANNIFKSCLER